MTTLNDEKYKFLTDALVTATQKHVGDLWLEWLMFEGAKTPTRMDAEEEYLDGRIPTVPAGVLSDRWFAHFGNLGHTGALSDRWLKFWLAGAVPP